MALTNAERQARYRERLGAKYRRATLTLPTQTFERLKKLAKQDGITQEVFLTTLIEGAWEASRKDGESVVSRQQ